MVATFQLAKIVWVYFVVYLPYIFYLWSVRYIVDIELLVFAIIILLGTMVGLESSILPILDGEKVVI